MVIHEVEQRTPEWFALRLGRVTGTKFQKMATGRPDTFETLCREIAAERLTGTSCERAFTVTDAMQHGIDTEAEARAAYEAETLTRVREVGFIERDKLFGCSPDGLVGDNGMVEIKCPQPSTHIGYWMDPPGAWKAYRWQVQGNLWVSGREWCDFVSYCPTFPDEKRILIVRVEPDEADQVKIHNQAVKLESRVSEILDALR